MPKPTSHIRRHLRASKPVAALLDEIEQREQLLSEIRGHLPVSMARHCHQASLRAGELTLFVDSPVWVDRLRFLCSELIASLVATGIEVETCRVRVLPLPPAALSMPRPAPPASCPAAERAGSHSQSSDGARSELSLALERLARTLKRAPF